MATTEGISSVPLQDGYFNDVAAIFARHAHPLIVVEECALRWMGVRHPPTMDRDLLVRDSQVEAITAALLDTGAYAADAQDIRDRLGDPLVARVTRLRYTGARPQPYAALSLWSETDYQLGVDDSGGGGGDATVAVPDLVPLNVTVAEERFDPGKPGIAESPLTGEARSKRGVRVVPRVRALTTTTNAPSPSSPSPPSTPSSPPPPLSPPSLDECAIYIPTIPRMVAALLRQHRQRVAYYAAAQERTAVRGGACAGADGGSGAAKPFPSLPMYHVECMIRYLHLECGHQRQKLLPELAPDIRRALEEKLDTYSRKPVVTAENIANSPAHFKGKQRRLLASHTRAAD